MVKVKINVQHFDSQGWAVATAQTDPDKRQQNAPCWCLFCVFKLNILNIFREQISSQHSTEECHDDNITRGNDQSPGPRLGLVRGKLISEAKEWAGNWPRVDPVGRIINCESLIPRWIIGQHCTLHNDQSDESMTSIDQSKVSTAHWWSGPGHLSSRHHIVFRTQQFLSRGQCQKETSPTTRSWELLSL